VGQIMGNFYSSQVQKYGVYCWYRAAECLSVWTIINRRVNWVLNKNCAFKILPFNIKDQLKLFPLF